MKIYQLKITGTFQMFPNTPANISSKHVFKNYPTEEQIKTFVDNCLNSDNPFANVDKTNYELKILELELI